MYSGRPDSSAGGLRGRRRQARPVSTSLCAFEALSNADHGVVYRSAAGATPAVCAAFSNVSWPDWLSDGLTTGLVGVQPAFQHLVLARQEGVGQIRRGLAIREPGCFNHRAHALV